MLNKFIFRLLSPQFKKPSGFIGKYVGNRMDKLNDHQNDWVISLLDLHPHDIVLEIGFGTGRTIKKIVKKVPQGKIYGIDPSHTLLHVATRLLRNEVDSGKVVLQEGYVENAEFPSDVTKVLAVHVVYFWNDLKKVFSKLYNFSAKGATIAIYYVSPILAHSREFHEYGEEEITKHLSFAGFKNVCIKKKKFGKQNGVCILAIK